VECSVCLDTRARKSSFPCVVSQLRGPELFEFPLTKKNFYPTIWPQTFLQLSMFLPPRYASPLFLLQRPCSSLVGTRCRRFWAIDPDHDFYRPVKYRFNQLFPAVVQPVLPPPFSSDPPLEVLGCDPGLSALTLCSLRTCLISRPSFPGSSPAAPRSTSGPLVPLVHDFIRRLDPYIL